MNILFITPTPPLPLSVGGNQRSYFLINALSKIGSVDLVISQSHDQLKESSGEKLWQNYSVVGCTSVIPSGERNFVTKLIRPLAPKFIDKVIYNLSASSDRFSTDANLRDVVHSAISKKQYDVIVCRYLKTFGQSALNNIDIPVVVDVDDLDSSIFESRLKMKNHWFKHLIFRRHLYHTKKAQGEIMQQCRGLWFSNPRDAQYLSANLNNYLPNIPLFPSKNMSEASITKKGLVLIVVGSWGHVPNLNGLLYFLDNIWPKIIANYPSILFRIIGSQLTPNIRSKLASYGNVDVVGFVDDLAAEYALCDAVLCPVYFGGGTNIKVLEAMAYGKPCVVTPYSFSGYSNKLENGRDILVAETNDGWLPIFKRLQEDVSYAKLIGTNASRMVEGEYSEAKFNEIVRKSILDEFHLFK